MLPNQDVTLGYSETTTILLAGLQFFVLLFGKFSFLIYIGVSSFLCKFYKIERIFIFFVLNTSKLAFTDPVE